MSQKIVFRLIRPSGIEYENQADILVLPGSEGELGIMYNHVPMVVQLKAGNVKLYNSDKVEASLSITAGIARINNESVDVLCE